MGKENLEVKARWRETGLTSEPYRIAADPDDTEDDAFVVPGMLKR